MAQRLKPSTGFRAIPGKGAEAMVAEKRVFVGRGEAGAIAVDVDGVRSGEFDIADEVKPEAAEPRFGRLRSMGIEVWMITGDNRRVAREIAREAGIDEAHVLAEVLPEVKEREVARLKSEGKRVAMVGDGINDAPALARADVGIAIGTGTDVAIDAAGIILMRGDLRACPTRWRWRGRHCAIIRQNLFWAFGYNALGIPIAAGVLYPFTGWMLSPMIASAAMALSSVSVVMNSLRLRHYRRKSMALRDVATGYEPAEAEIANDLDEASVQVFHQIVASSPRKAACRRRDPASRRGISG